MSARSPAVIFVLITITLDMLALGIVIPVLPALVVDFAGGDTATGARLFGLLGASWALMQLLFSPVTGMLADRFGRRPVILLSNLGLGLDYLLMALAPNLAWLFVGRIVSGICASSIAAANAYIADVTPPEKRAGAFGLVGAAFGIGFVLGPALGGLLGHSDPRLPFWVAAALSLANFAYGWFVLPESLPPEARTRFLWRAANPLGSLALLRSQPQLLGLGTVFFLHKLAHVSLPATWVLYVGYRYGWGSAAVGLTLALVGVASGLVEGVLVRIAVARIGARAALLAGLGFGIAGFLLMALAPTGTLFTMAIPLLALWGLATASLQGIMSAKLGADRQGQLQGATSSIMGLAALVGPLLFPLSLAAAIEHGGGLAVGAPYLAAALLLGLAAILALRVTEAVPPAVQPLDLPATSTSG